MISLIILIILFFGILRGLKRGFFLQLLHLIGFIVAFIVASIYYAKLARHLVSFIPYPELPEDQAWAVFLNAMPLENAFYNAIAFVMIFVITKVILQIIASMLDFVSRIPVLRQLNQLMGAILGFVEVYLVVFIFLYIFALAPIGKIQDYIASSSVATMIIEHTPVLSKAIENLWFTDLLALI